MLGSVVAVVAMLAVEVVVVGTGAEVKGVEEVAVAVIEMIGESVFTSDELKMFVNIVDG